MKSSSSALLCATPVFALWLLPLLCPADDWPQWMGPHRDGIWREDGIVETFPPAGPKLLWETAIDHGYAGPGVSGGRVVLMDRQIADPAKVPENPFSREGIPGTERVLCLDSKDGRIIWQHRYDCQYTISYASGPRTTPTVDGDRVYALGAEGHLWCFQLSDGKELWSKHFPTLFNLKTPTWGFAASPLIDGDLLICLAGGDGSTAVAFDKKTGVEKWRGLSAGEPGYCPPRIIEHQGRRLLLIWHPEAINALDPQSGALLWTVPWKIRAGLSVPSPQLHGDQLFISSFYNGSTCLDLAGAANPSVAWQTERASEKRTTHLHGIMSTPFPKGNHVYGVCSYGEFRCLELESGKRVWESMEPTSRETRKKRWFNVFITPHEDRYFLFNEQGDLIIARLSPLGYKEVSRAHLIEPDCLDMRQRQVVWSHPAYANRSCFVRNDSMIRCYSLAEE